MTATKPGAERSYKRSWKNLLLNKRYQLRFTLFMVGLASLLMVGLGIWVMRVANETTMVSMASARGEGCPKVFPDPDAAQTASSATVPMRLDEANAAANDAAIGDSPVAPPAGATGEPAAPPPAPPAPSAPASPPSALPTATTDEEPRQVKVQIEESQMTTVVAPPAPPVSIVPVDIAERVATYWTCELRQTARIDRLERGRTRILWAMVGTGIVLVLGLAIYGIKMTHKVAGPLFKVSLYLSKMRAGRFDKVYNLRKGDQLVEFYDAFKAAHGGVVAMQRDDIARIAAVIAAAEAAGAGQHPEVAALRALLERKEKSIE